MKELICIVCPRGCHLKVDENNDHQVSGNACPRGVQYGKNELLHPTRVITSTVQLTRGMHKRLPVKTASPIPKKLMFDVMKALDDVVVDAPVKRDQVVLANVCDTGVDVIATRDIERGE